MDAITNEHSGYYKEQVGRFAEYMTAPPVQEGYEVSVQDLNLKNLHKRDTAMPFLFTSDIRIAPTPTQVDQTIKSAVCF